MEQMDQNRFQLEMLSYAEKISLSELEVSKAQQRVSELKFERDRFSKDMFMLSLKASEKPPESPQVPQ